MYLRIRPFVEREEGAGADVGSHRKTAASVIQVLDGGSAEDGTHGTSVLVGNPRSLSASLLAMPTASAVAGETFTFDAVGGADVQQEDVFAAVSKTITENCLMGYNGTIFA